MSLSTWGRTWEEASSPIAVRMARRYETNWREAAAPDRRPDLNRFLAEAERVAGGRLAILRADLALRWESGEKVDAGRYRSVCADLGGEEFVALVYEEYCLREEGEESPQAGMFLEKYPEVASSLRRVLDIHGLVGSGTTSGSMALQEPSAPEVVFPLAGETIAGFRLTEELGRGAFARVFRAEERQLADRPVALKVSRTGSREPQTLARLQHTHIVPVYSYRTDELTGLHLLCMPFYGRVTLARVLADPQVRGARTGSELLASIDRHGEGEPASMGRSGGGRPALERRTYAQAIAWWGARMAEALEHAHERGVLHRDVKPSNVLVTGDGMPMLLDFNLARELVVEEQEAERALPGGTLDYMAPEQIEELAEGVSERVDARSDIYGLGVLLYESLMGARPFSTPKGAASVGELLMRALEEREAGAPKLRARRPEVSATMEAVVRKCLEPVPGDRYRTAAELAFDLQAFADDRPLKHAREPWPERSYRWGRRYKRALATVVPLLLAGVVLATVLVKGQVSRNRQWTVLKQMYDEGQEAEAAGDYARAKVRYESASRMVETPGGEGLKEGEGRLMSRPSGVWSSLEELRQQARSRYLVAERAEETRKRADELSRKAVILRFRLLGFGRDLRAAGRSLEEAFRPFHVFEPGEWLKRPDLSLLDEGRRQRLAIEVNELLFLWAIALDEEGDAVALHRALEISDLALTFAAPDGAWRALRVRFSDRLIGKEPARVSAGAGEELSARGNFQWGLLWMREGGANWGEAIGRLRKSVMLEEGNYWYQFYLAFALDTAGGDSNDALRHYDAAVALKPKSPWVRFSRARLYRGREEWVLAVGEFQRALGDFHALEDSSRDKEFESQVRLELGLTRQSLGDLAGARGEYAIVTAMDRSGKYERAARLNLARADADAGAFKRARREFDALLNERPKDSTTRLGRALLALRVGDPAGAEADLTAILQGEPKGPARAEALAYRAVARLGLRQASKAAADSAEALRINPSPGLERLNIRSRVALGTLGSVSLTHPEDIAALPVNGRALREDLGRLCLSLQRELTAMELGRDAAGMLRARLSMAVALAALGNERGALTEANRAVALAPLSMAAYLTRARVAMWFGQKRDALRDVEESLAIAPEDPRAWELRGLVRSRDGDLAGGLEDLNRAIALGGDGSMRGTRAVILLAKGDAKNAVRDWTDAIRHDPDDPLAFVGRAEAYLKLGMWDRALGDLEAATGWSDGRLDVILRVGLAYTRCLRERPRQLPRVFALARRAWASVGSG